MLVTGDVVVVDDLPVYGREGVTSPVSVEDGAFLVDVDGLSHSSAEPVGICTL